MDYDNMGAAQLEEPTFASVLVKSVTMVKPFVSPYTMNISFQSLYPNVVSYILQNPNTDIEITPEVIWSMLQDISNLKAATAPVEDITAAAERTPILLPPDPNKVYASTNLVDGEVWAVDTTSNKKVIFPVAGTFYRDSVKICRGKVDSVSSKLSDPDQMFKEGKDYIITGPDAYGIKHTSNTSGVYRLIIFISAYVGDVTVMYHAYGGEPTQYDIRTVHESLHNLYTYLTDAQIPTAKNLGGFPVMVEFRSRLAALEENMRKFATSGKPSYGDVTSGTCLVKKISSTDTELHWWTIAELYKVAGSDTVFIADMAHLQIQSKYTKLMLDVNVGANLEYPGKKLKVTTINDMVSQGIVPFVDDSGLDNLLRPQFRIVYNVNTIEGSGIYLQIGLRLRGVAEETLAITDLSGQESCWKLIASVEEAVLPEDDNILLPSGNHYWSVANPDSRTESMLAPFHEGHVCWVGDEALNTQGSGLRSSILEHFLESDIDISRIKRMELRLEESASNRFIIGIDMCGDDTNMVGFASSVYGGKPVTMALTISRHPVTKELTMKLDYEVTVGNTAPRLGLRYVHAYT